MSVKNAANKKKHKVSFEAAVFALEDPLALSMIDSRYQEERWITLGRSGNRILYVARLVLEAANEEVIRIISAREATARERRQYYHDRGTGGRTGVTQP